MMYCLSQRPRPLTFIRLSVKGYDVARDLKRISRAVTKRRVFLAFLFVIALFAVFGDKGIVELLRVKGELRGILEQNIGLERENRKVEREITLLKSDRRYIEHIAKKELGMIRKNEMIYRLEPSE